MGKLLNWVGVPLIIVGGIAVGLYFYGMDREPVVMGAGYGADPVLVKPNPTLMPTINIAPAKGWAIGQKPLAAPDFSVQEFASGLDHPRWLLAMPNGDVLVAETNAPPKPDDAKGIKGWVMGLVMKRAGAGVASANRITLLRDTNADGVADIRSVYIENLNSPFGMALSRGKLFVANTNAIVAFPYLETALKITTAPEKIIDLPAGTINHHWTKDVIASADGNKLFVTVGSNSNVAENGMAVEENRASVLEVDLAAGTSRVFASGLRNPNGLSWQPDTGALWVVVNERDEIGNDLVPDYMTTVKYGAFYGWPYSYYGQHLDSRAQPQRPDLVKKATVPDYALGAHTASLGLTFNTGKLFTGKYADGAFVGQHGSWNRKPRSGYKVVFVQFSNGQPIGLPIDVLTGFLDGDGNAMGRPVGVAIDATGALLVADDVGNKIWRVSNSVQSTDVTQQ